MKYALLAALVAALFAVSVGAASADRIELQWWHAMTAVNAARVNKIAADFNASQREYQVVPVFKGTYAETMTPASPPTAPASRRTSCRSSRSAQRR